MPYVLRPKGLRPTVTALLCAAATLAVPAAAHAAACPATPTTKAFQAVGDDADYSLVPSGDFETGADGWSLNRAWLAGGSAPFAGSGPGDSKSLAISANGSAVSPAVCVDVRRPTFRFAVRRTSGMYGAMFVKVRWQTDNGASGEWPVGAAFGGTTWQASETFMLGGALPLVSDDQSASVRLVFEPLLGAWAIDNVYIDPYARG